MIVQNKNKIVKALEALGVLVKTESHVHKVGDHVILNHTKKSEKITE